MPSTMAPMSSASSWQTPQLPQTVEGHGVWQTELTTVMICNLPCTMPLPSLIKVMDELGFARKYDLVHLPAGGRTFAAMKSNLGYGFVNFKSAEYAADFQKAFEGHIFPDTNSKKVATVCYARVQGFMDTLLHSKKKSGKRLSRGTFLLSV